MSLSFWTTERLSDTLRMFELAIKGFGSLLRMILREVKGKAAKNQVRNFPLLILLDDDLAIENTKNRSIKIMEKEKKTR